MTPRQRVLTALSRGQPDRVPYYETGISAGVLRVLGVDPDDQPAISRRLGRDSIVYTGGIQPPWNCDIIEVPGGTNAYIGRIRTRADLAKLDLGPADLSAVQREATAFNERKADFASCGMVVLGLSTMIMSMGYEAFCIAIYDDPPFVADLLDRFVDDAVRRIELANRCGFDLYQVQEDIAFKTAPMVSPQWYAETAVPRLKRAAQAMTRPFVFHSDGNIGSLLPCIVGLGAAAINPVEPDAMDLQAVKQEYGDRLAIAGNIDLNFLVSGTPEQVRADVARCMRQAKAGGGYLASSSNSITDEAQPLNVLAIVQAIVELGGYD